MASRIPCPQCGTENYATDAVCLSCGAQVATTTAALATDAQRRATGGTTVQASPSPGSEPASRAPTARRTRGDEGAAFGRWFVWRILLIGTGLGITIAAGAGALPEWCAYIGLALVLGNLYSLVVVPLINRRIAGTASKVRREERLAEQSWGTDPSRNISPGVVAFKDERELKRESPVTVFLSADSPMEITLILTTHRLLVCARQPLKEPGAAGMWRLGELQEVSAAHGPQGALLRVKRVGSAASDLVAPQFFVKDPGAWADAILAAKRAYYQGGVPKP